MDFTVAICTWNRSALLRQTLERLTSLAVPTGRRWELLIVDNNSSDDTAAVAAAFADRLPIRYLRELKQGLSNARNLALAAGVGEVIVYTDDDVLVEPEWLTACADALARFPRAAAFGGLIVPWFPETPDPDLAAAFPILAGGFCGLDHGPSARLLEPSEEIYGANMAFRRSAIAGLEFDPQLGASARTGMVGEEVDFVKRVRIRGGEVAWVPDMRVAHYVDPTRMELSYLTRYYEGAGRSHIRQLGRCDDPGVGGVPFWMLRQYAEHRLEGLRSRWGGSRLARLSAVRKASYAKGMIQESFLNRRRTPMPPHQARAQR